MKPSEVLIAAKGLIDGLWIGNVCNYEQMAAFDRAIALAQDSRSEV